MSTTAGDQINAALRLIGQLAEGETPSAATSQDALAALNQMLDSWNTDRLLVYTTQTQVFLGLLGKQRAQLARLVILLATGLFLLMTQRILTTPAQVCLTASS
jgi:hypothetical protein